MEQNSNREDLQKSEKLRTTIAYPREDIIATITQCFDHKGILYGCAPFKAEWQLCYLEKGLIDGILGVDGDIPFLSGNQFVHDFTYNNNMCVLV